MELVRKDMPARSYLSGNQLVQLGERDKIRVQVKRDDIWEDIIEETVPRGKKWNIQMSLYVEEE